MTSPAVHGDIIAARDVFRARASFVSDCCAKAIDMTIASVEECPFGIRRLATQAFLSAAHARSVCMDEWANDPEGMDRERTHVYAVAAQSVGLVKFGIARDVRVRMRGLALASPVQLELWAAWPGVRWSEAVIHECLRRHRRHGEWFEINDCTSTLVALMRKNSRRVPTEWGAALSLSDQLPLVGLVKLA